MADIALGIDVDTTTVIHAEKAFDRLGGRLRDTQGRFVAVGAAADTADREIRGFADGARMVDDRVAAASGGLGRMQAQISGISGVLSRGAGLFQAYIGYQVVQGIVTSADAWATLNARMEQAVGSQEAAGAVLDEVAGIAGRTQQRVSAVADSWLRLQPALAEAGRSTQEISDFTEALNAALLVSGARGSEAAAVQLQLAQAMASGVLRGDELNSIMEQGAKVTRLIAEEMGVGVGQLRNLAEQGLVTGDVIDRALRGNLEELRSEAAAMPTTVGAAFGGLADAAQRLAGEVNEATGATGILAGAIEGLAGIVGRLSDELDGSSDAAVAWAANLDAASRAAATSTARNISVAIVALDELKRAQASITPLEGDSPFTIDPGYDRVGNAIDETEKLVRLEKQRLEGQRERAVVAQQETQRAAALEQFTNRINTAIDSAVVPIQKVEASMGGASRGASGAAKATEDIAANGKTIVDQARDYADQWDRAYGSIGRAMQGLVTGQNGADELFSRIADGLFGDKLDTAFKDAAKSLTDAIGSAFNDLGSGTGLSGDAMTYVGAGIGIAAAGALNGSASQIGSGIGSAIGGALGQSFGPAIGSSIGGGLGTALGALGGPVGMVLGGAIGGFITKLFSNDSTWESVNGTAFSGTSYAQNASVRVNSDNPDPTADARLAYAGTVKLLENFNRELVQFVEAAGGTLRTGADRVVKETQAVKAITGVLDAGDVPGSGAEAQQLAQEISAKVAEIMGIAGQIAAKAGPPLTQAQQLWRETQARFSEENIAILRDLGFSAREILKAQEDVRRDLAQGFEKEQLESLVDTGRASEEMLREWRRAELRELEERREQAIRTAREIGASLDIVRANFRAQGADIQKEFRDMLADMADAVQETVSRMDRLQYRGGILDELVSDGASSETARRWLTTSKAILDEQRKDAIQEARRLGVDVSLVRQLYHQRLVDLEKRYGEMRNSAAQEAAEKAQAVIERLTSKMNAIDSRRAEVMQELANRAEKARQAEQTLADARANLTAGDLAPGGPLDRLAELQRQFGEAITAAKGGDADAATRAASLASSLLQQGQQVYASSGAYSDLFQSVNSQLLAAQGRFDVRADRIEARLDPETFTAVTEKSTAALLRALGRMSEQLDEVKDELARQTRRADRAEQTRRVGNR